MEALMSDLVKEMRLAMDEVNHDELNDIFADDSEEEMKQAIETAAQQLLLQAPPQFLKPSLVKVSIDKESLQDYDAAQTQYTDGHGSIVVPDDFLKLAKLKLRSWTAPLTELMEEGSNEAKMQASRWTRGTPQKPKGMLTTNQWGNRELMYWTAGKYQQKTGVPIDQVYDHTVEVFAYIPTIKVVEGNLSVALIDVAKKNIIYRAVSIFLTSKKESDLAEKYLNLSQF